MSEPLYCMKLSEFHSVRICTEFWCAGVAVAGLLHPGHRDAVRSQTVPARGLLHRGSHGVRPHDQDRRKWCVSYRLRTFFGLAFWKHVCF